MTGTFVVARNPDAESKLPYLLRLPIDGGIELKAREPWPATTRVYCHPLDEGWPKAAEVLEEVPVRRCARRGRAVDLVLDRPRHNRSQFVFTQPHADRRGGRTMIFWQTARTARRARPGQRVPTLGFQLAELAGVPTAAVVVEDRYAALAGAPRVTAGWPCELVAQLQVRYPSVPIVFADSRKLAEDWTPRFLAAAAAHHGAAPPER